MSYERSSKPNHNVGNAETGYASGTHARHPHTIDRWDDATGKNLIGQIAGVTDCQNSE